MWTNWAGDQRCEPAAIERPTAVGRGRRAPSSARVAAGRCVRVAGSGHSFTGAVLTDGTLLSLDRMGALLDADSGQRPRPRRGRHPPARPQRGARRARPGAAQPRRHRRAVDRRRDRDRHARHRRDAAQPLGAGARRCASSAAPGDVLDIDGGDDLLAARVAVGALGVVTEVTLQTVPAFTLRGVDAPAAAGRGPRRARRARRRPPPLRVLRLPARRQRADAHQRRRRRAAAPAARSGAHGSTTCCWPTAPSSWRASSAAPSRARSRRSTASSRAWSGTSTRVDRSDRIFASPRLVRFTEMEYALPRPVAADAVRAIKATAERYAINFPIEVRFVAPRRRAAQPGPRARDRLRRRARLQGHGVGAVLPRRRGDRRRARRPPALGQAPLPDRRHAGRRATRGGSASRPSARGWTPTGCSPTPTPTACSGRSPPASDGAARRGAVRHEQQSIGGAGAATGVAGAVSRRSSGRGAQRRQRSIDRSGAHATHPRCPGCAPPLASRGRPPRRARPPPAPRRPPRPRARPPRA